MREILFRGKRLINDEWVEGLLVKDRAFYGKPENHAYIVNHECPSGCFGRDIYFEVDPATVGQYTGLTDKNGKKKIFEGDIVLGRFEFGMKVPSLVVFRDGAFGLAWGHSGKNFFTAFTGFCNVTFEVIGNVFDNPELLNKEA